MKVFSLVLFLFFPTSEVFAQSKEIIQTEKAPKAIGPYSQAVKSKGFIYLAGQLGINPTTGELAADSFETEVKQALENIKAVLEASGGSMIDIVNTTVYLTELSKFSIFNDIYGTYFTENFPARTTVGAYALPKNARIEIAVVAISKD
jgi:2-iminobutanoate/2-iminopropanoate deaminase